jgi:hypothetical protein
MVCGGGPENVYGGSNNVSAAIQSVAYEVSQQTINGPNDVYVGSNHVSTAIQQVSQLHSYSLVSTCTRGYSDQQSMSLLHSLLLGKVTAQEWCAAEILATVLISSETCCPLKGCQLERCPHA